MESTETSKGTKFKSTLAILAICIAAAAVSFVYALIQKTEAKRQTLLATQSAELAVHNQDEMIKQKHQMKKFMDEAEYQISKCNAQNDSLRKVLKKYKGK